MQSFSPAIGIVSQRSLVLTHSDNNCSSLILSLCCVGPNPLLHRGCYVYRLHVHVLLIHVCYC